MNRLKDLYPDLRSSAKEHKMIKYEVGKMKEDMSRLSEKVDGMRKHFHRGMVHNKGNRNSVGLAHLILMGHCLFEYFSL